MAGLLASRAGDSYTNGIPTQRIPTLERRFALGDAGCKIVRIDGMTQSPLARRRGRCLPRFCRLGSSTVMEPCPAANRLGTRLAAGDECASFAILTSIEK